MARIRTIKPEFFRHKKLFELEKSSKLPLRVAFAGLFTASDREGRFKWEPDTLKLDCLPWDTLDFAKVLDWLHCYGFIERYEVGGKAYGCLPSWKEHQVINNREADSKIPAITADTVTRHGNYQEEGKGRELEGKGKEGNSYMPVTVKPRGKTAAAYAADPEFDSFWKAYPRKTAKGDAFKAWKLSGAPLEAVLTALGWQRRDPEWTKDDGKWIPYPASYLRAQRWTDEPPKSLRPQQERRAPLQMTEEERKLFFKERGIE